MNLFSLQNDSGDTRRIFPWERRLITFCIFHGFGSGACLKRLRIRKMFSFALIHREHKQTEAETSKGFASVASPSSNLISAKLSPWCQAINHNSSANVIYVRESCCKMSARPIHHRQVRAPSPFS